MRALKYKLCFLSILSIFFVPLAMANENKELKIEQLPKIISSKLGLGFPGNETRYYSVLADAGLGIVRLGVSWKFTEVKKGKYRWKTLDRKILALQKLGIEPFLTLYSDAPWGVMDKNSQAKNKRPKDPKTWAKFVQKLVERYDGDGKNDAPNLIRKVRFYQVANEWISDKNKSGGWDGNADELIGYINSSYASVKRADKSSIFVLGGIAAFNLDLMSMLKGYSDKTIHQKFSATSSVTIKASQVKNMGFGDKQKDVFKVLENTRYDYADVHLYGETSRNKSRIKAIRKHIGNKPLLSSECGGPSLDYLEKYTGDRHFTAVFDWNLSSLSQGLDYCVWFKLGEGSGATWGNRKVALFDINKKPKPGFYAYRLLANVLNGSKNVIYLRDGVYKITYKTGAPIVIAWQTGSKQLSAGLVKKALSANAKLDIIEFTNVSKGLYRVKSRKYNTNIPLSELPVIISTSLPATLKQQ